MTTLVLILMVVLAALLLPLDKLYKKWFLWHLRERRYTSLGRPSPKGYDYKTVNKDGQMEFHRKVKQ